MVILYWLLWNSGRSKAERLSHLESAKRVTELEYMRRMFPVPCTWYERIALSIALHWIDREIHKAANLPAGISERALRMVTVKKG